MKNLILAIDQGTTGTTVLAIDESGRVISRAGMPCQGNHAEKGDAEASRDFDEQM